MVAEHKYKVGDRVRNRVDYGWSVGGLGTIELIDVWREGNDGRVYGVRPDHEAWKVVLGTVDRGEDQIELVVEPTPQAHEYKIGDRVRTLLARRIRSSPCRACGSERPRTSRASGSRHHAEDAA